MIILETFENIGETYPYEWVRFNKESGLWYRGQVTCMSSVCYGGTCQCHSHSPEEEWVISRKEVKRLLQEALDEGKAFSLTQEEVDSLENPTLEDLIMERLALHDIRNMEEVEEWVSTSYKLNLNPLPALRRIVGNIVPVIFVHWDEQTYYYDEEPALLVKLDEEGNVCVALFEP